MSMLGFLGTSTTAGGGMTPVNRIMVRNDVLDVKTNSMEMEQTISKHDTVTLALSSPSLTSTFGIIGEPISFVYGLGTRTDVFFGYVIAVAEEQKNSSSLTFNLRVFGTTVSMSLGKPRFWTSKTIPSVVRDLVNANGLGYAGGEHDHIWKALAQTDKSDWAVCAQLVERIGFILFTWNGLVGCEDPQNLFNRSGPYMRLIQAANVESTERQLLDFTPTSDTEVTYEGKGTSIAYLTSDGGVGWAKQAGYLDHKFVTGFPIRSQQEGEVYVNAFSRRSESWLQTATARINGDASIHPSMCVDVVTSTAVKDKRFDGKWMVLGVKHNMDDKTFQTKLVLGRPDVSSPQQQVPYIPFWGGGPLGKPTMFLKESSGSAPPTWVSSWNDSRAGSIS